MEPSTEEKKRPDPSRAPRVGVRLMIAIFLGLLLVSIYSNIQKSRRAEIERVTITPASTATPAARSR